MYLPQTLQRAPERHPGLGSRQTARAQIMSGSLVRFGKVVTVRPPARRRGVRLHCTWRTDGSSACVFWIGGDEVTRSPVVVRPAGPGRLDIRLAGRPRIPTPALPAPRAPRGARAGSSSIGSRPAGRRLLDPRCQALRQTSERVSTHPMSADNHRPLDGIATTRCAPTCDDGEPGEFAQDATGTRAYSAAVNMVWPGAF